MVILHLLNGIRQLNQRAPLGARDIIISLSLERLAAVVAEHLRITRIAHLSVLMIPVPAVRTGAGAYRERLLRHAWPVRPAVDESVAIRAAHRPTGRRPTTDSRS